MELPPEFQELSAQYEKAKKLAQQGEFLAAVKQIQGVLDAALKNMSKHIMFFLLYSDALAFSIQGIALNQAAALAQIEQFDSAMKSLDSWLWYENAATDIIDVVQTEEAFQSEDLLPIRNIVLHSHWHNLAQFFTRLSEIVSTVENIWNSDLSTVDHIPERTKEYLQKARSYQEKDENLGSYRSWIDSFDSKLLGAEIAFLSAALLYSDIHKRINECLISFRKMRTAQEVLAHHTDEIPQQTKITLDNGIDILKQQWEVFLRQIKAPISISKDQSLHEIITQLEKFSAAQT